jgi:hypothetical protein
VKFNKLTRSAVVLSVAAALAVPTFGVTSANAASKASTWKSAKDAGGIAKIAAACKKDNSISSPHQLTGQTTARLLITSRRSTK